MNKIRNAKKIQDEDGLRGEQNFKIETHLPVYAIIDNTAQRTLYTNSIANI